MNDYLAALVGQRIPGGCDQCPDPYQTVKHDLSGVWIVTVHHDDGCPFLTHHQGDPA